MIIKLNLPIIMYFDDYHDILDFSDKLKNISSNMKCKELNINYDYYDVSPYVALIYKGDLKRDKVNREYLKSWKKLHYFPLRNNNCV